MRFWICDRVVIAHVYSLSRYLWNLIFASSVRLALFIRMQFESSLRTSGGVDTSIYVATIFDAIGSQSVKAILRNT